METHLSDKYPGKITPRFSNLVNLYTKRDRYPRDVELCFFLSLDGINPQRKVALKKLGLNIRFEYPSINCISCKLINPELETVEKILERPYVSKMVQCRELEEHEVS